MTVSFVQCYHYVIVVQQDIFYFREINLLENLNTAFHDRATPIEKMVTTCFHCDLHATNAFD